MPAGTDLCVPYCAVSAESGGWRLSIWGCMHSGRNHWLHAKHRQPLGQPSWAGPEAEVPTSRTINGQFAVTDISNVLGWW